MAVLILQRGGKLLDPVALTLALFIQNKAQVVPIPDQLRNAVVLFHEVTHFGQDTPNVQQGAVLQSFDLQLLQRQCDLTG